MPRRYHKVWKIAKNNSKETHGRHSDAIKQPAQAYQKRHKTNLQHAERNRLTSPIGNNLHKIHPAPITSDVEINRIHTRHNGTSITTYRLTTSIYNPDHNRTAAGRS